MVGQTNSVTRSIDITMRLWAGDAEEGEEEKMETETNRDQITWSNSRFWFSRICELAKIKIKRVQRRDQNTTWNPFKRIYQCAKILSVFDWSVSVAHCAQNTEQSKSNQFK